MCNLNEEENDTSFSFSKKANDVFAVYSSVQPVPAASNTLLELRVQSWLLLGWEGLRVALSLQLPGNASCTVTAAQFSLWRALSFLSQYTQFAVFVTSRCLGSAYTFAAVFHNWGVIAKMEITPNAHCFK